MRLHPSPRSAHVAPAALALIAAVTATLAAPTHADPARAAPAPALRWTDGTPDAMVEDAAARAGAPGVPEHARLAAMATILALSDQASNGRADAALRSIAAAPGATGEVRAEAALLARSLAGDEGTEAGQRADRELGVAQRLLVLGPFRDTGGGLDARDGPELPDAFFDPAARYSWGAFEVAWRALPSAFASARGIPLDVFVSPRRESCTWIATTLRLERARPLWLRVAASGQVRVVFDGKDIGRDDAVHEAAHFERLAARVEGAAGDHLFAAKVCAGALDDDGRARLRVTDETGHWPTGVSETGRLPERAAASAGSPRGSTPVIAHAEATPLGSALGVTAASDPDARLDAAIVRTLGGADDLRSPRAPGILAALADQKLDADRLAMVAWLAPNGANRGAWLRRARPDADAATRAFVDRRLVERHLDAQLADWACAALRGAKIDAGADPEAALLAARVDAALGTDALRIQALRRVEAVFHAAPKAAPDALLDWLAQTAEGLDPALAAEARQELAARGQVDGDWVRVVAATRDRADAVREGERAFAEGSIDDADDGVAVAQAISGAGAHDEAGRLFELLSRWAPNRAPVWAGLAREAGAAAGGGARERGSGIAEALRRARELDPGEARYRAELALRTRAPTLAPESRDDEKYLVPSAVILARRQPAAPAARTEAPEVADRQLHWLRAVVMHPDRRVSELVHYAREIVIPPRTEDDLFEDVPAEGDLTEILRARVHRRDGTTAFPVEEANENGRARIRWPELRSGDVVEVAFRSWTGGPVGGRGDPPFYRLDYAGALSTHPVLYNEVVVESPADGRPIFVDVVNGKPDSREDENEGGKHVVRLVWTKPVNVADEPLAPPLSEVIPTVVISTFQDWNAFRSWYGEAVRGFTEPDAQVRELAAELTRGKTTREAKLRALFDFVADDIRYVNYVSGEWWLPNRPQQLLARREGDCDDKAILLITLLRAVGIDAEEVMVQTRLTGQPSIVRAPGAAVPLFDHGIAFLPGPHGGTYLDATSPQSRLGPLPSMDARAVALRMEGPPEIVQLPASSPEDHGVDATWTIRLAEGGSADLEGVERASGDDAFWMRTNLTEPGARAQWVEDHLVGSWFPTVQVDKDVDFQGDLARGAARVHWRARSDGLARHEGAELVVPLAPAETLASQLAPLLHRTLPVWLPPFVAPRSESRTIRVVAPKGYRFEAVPQAASRGEENGGPFGSARLEIAADPRDPAAVVVKRTVIFDQNAIAKDDYPRWRAWIQRVDAMMHRSLRLAPAGSPR